MTPAWRIVKDAVLLEVAIWRCLARWLVRRPDAPAGATQLGYARLTAPVMWLWIFGAFAEVVAFELVLRAVDATWADVVRIPLFVVGVWGAFWMLGMAASFSVRRHLVLADRLVIRNGPRLRVDVPLASVTAVRGVEHEFEGLVRSVHEADGLLLVGPGNRTNVELALAGPTALVTHDGERVVERVGFWVDEPREVTRLLAGLGAS
ncbi:hypothetical protein [Nocardioides nitrophenolicus]|uniref:hypothetical protein n=1 Tax=Nocardioides nitrophenolicus TaxID=60489 RepID=UPI001956C517|nr:hypothetical protein [Nocardioides nitrophenolicus]MBM7517652.1 hypothetical protein [Nocardioides nitrophenolicus]